MQDGATKRWFAKLAPSPREQRCLHLSLASTLLCGSGESSSTKLVQCALLFCILWTLGKCEIAHTPLECLLADNYAVC